MKNINRYKYSKILSLSNNFQSLAYIYTDIHID